MEMEMTKTTCKQELLGYFLSHELCSYYLLLLLLYKRDVYSLVVTGCGCRVCSDSE